MAISIVENRDCMDAMKEFPDKYFDLAIVDPPYGIFGGGRADSIKSDTFGWFKKKIKEGSGGTWASKYGKKSSIWDNRPSEEYFVELKRVSKNQIIFGANHLGYPFDNYIIWNKLLPEQFTMGMCEMASVSIKGNPKIVKEAPQNPNRFHPCQKPMYLYEWLLNKYAKVGDKIIDSHLGGGEIRDACHKLGFDFYGYELDKDYFDASVKRFEQFKSQQKLF